jgi:uncharacterized protein YjaZ
MKRPIRKWTLRLLATGLLIAGLLLIIVLNPMLTYANQSTHRNFSIYHNQALDPLMLPQLDTANELLKASEFYTTDLQIDLCLNDGSKYPAIITAMRGSAFASGFYNKVVLQGNMHCKDNYLELNGHHWNLTQLLTHEMVHCLQFSHLGFWHSNPVAALPIWKWEGYAEYVSRQNVDQKDLSKNIARLIATDKSNWEITFTDNTIAPRAYYESWTLVQYCLDIKKMTYKQILADTTSEQTVRQEMLSWFSGRE